MIPVNTDMIPVQALLLLLFCLTCGSRAAPLTCERLLRPLDQLDPHHLEGRWVLVAGSLSHLPFMDDFKRRDSATSSFSTNQSDITMRRNMRLNDQCYYTSYNISLEGSSFTFRDGNVTTTFIHTSCHDCILMSFDVESGKRLHFYLFSRRRQLQEEEMEKFRTQVECLKLPTPAVMDPTKELCPEEKDGGSAAKTEEKPQENNN